MAKNGQKFSFLMPLKSSLYEVSNYGKKIKFVKRIVQ